MKINIFGLLFMCACFTHLSCSKYLDKKNNSSITTPTTLTSLQAILDNSDYFNIATTPAYGEASCGDYFISDNDYNSYTESRRAIYAWEPVDYFYNNDWAASYSSVYYSNLCLESLQNITLSESNMSQWNAVKGSALFLRSYAFLNLVWTFSKTYDTDSSKNDLGVDLRLQTDYNIPSRRSSVEEAYSRIISDVKESLSLLPALPAHVFRPGKAAALALLGRVYLSMRVYDSAYKYANLCLDLKNDLIDYNTIIDSRVPFATTAYSGETLFYSSMMSSPASELIDPGYGKARVDTNLYQTYSNDDLRKKLFFVAKTGYFEFKGNYGTSNSPLFSGLATNEILLIRSECNARSGQLTKAFEDLNLLLRKRWNKNVTYHELSAASVSQALDIILAERRKELVMRGLRWMDIKRLNKEGRSILLRRLVGGKSYYLYPNDKRYALPLPADIISMTGMKQN